MIRRSKEEIQIGDYAISKNRLYITKVSRITKLKIFARQKEKGYEYIVNFNDYDFYDDIMDIIKVEDYVNGYKIDFIQDNWVVFNHNHPYRLNILKKDIKSVTTKEQFEHNQFKVW